MSNCKLPLRALISVDVFSNEKTKTSKTKAKTYFPLQSASKGTFSVTIFGLLVLLDFFKAYFQVLSILSCVSELYCFYGRIIFHDIDPILFIHSSADTHLCCFYLGAVIPPWTFKYLFVDMCFQFPWVNSCEWIC